jgi:hypothetical protein
MTANTFHKPQYGVWAGNNQGHKPDLDRCAAEVPHNPGGWYTVQCGRKRGHGPEGAFCKQHAKKHEATP